MKVLVLAGGDSSEREVSLNTGAAVTKALQRQGHDVLAADPLSGKSLLDDQGQYTLESVAMETEQPVSTSMLVESLGDPRYADVDVVFIALHGGAGENGTIQALLDMAGIKYTGSGMKASAIAMDKAVSKHLMTSVDVLTPDWQLYHIGDDTSLAAAANDIKTNLGLPLIIKPNSGGSTVGLTRVTETNQIQDALRVASSESSDVLVEAYVPGRELTVTVFDGKAYPVVEIRPNNELYDYESKYTKGGSEYLAPAPVDDEKAKVAQENACRVYNVMGARGLARVDFILAEDGNVFCLELNTLPGMTDLSLAPMAMKCVGVDFDGLVARIVESAAKDC